MKKIAVMKRKLFYFHIDFHFELLLGNLITDAIIDYHVNFSHPKSFWAPAAIALWNGGGIRSSINKGILTHLHRILMYKWRQVLGV